MREPRKIVHWEPDGRYPKHEQNPAMYVCTSEACSSPIVEPDRVPDAAAPFRAAPEAARCSPR